MNLHLQFLALDTIKALKDKFGNEELVIGAGTVLDSEKASALILVDSIFIVSPGFDQGFGELCNTYQVPYLPGCMTITEMLTAMKAGSDIIKLFLDSTFGPSFVKTVKGPLPQVKSMPTRGVSLDNVKEWTDNGIIAVWVASEITKTA